jgi:hypothetical protein
VVAEVVAEVVTGAVVTTVGGAVVTAVVGWPSRTLKVAVAVWLGWTDSAVTRYSSGLKVEASTSKENVLYVSPFCTLTVPEVPLNSPV